MTGFGYGILGFGAFPNRVSATFSAAFNTLTGQALNTVITSNVVTVTEIPGGSAISVSSTGTGATAQYRINSGSWTSSAGSIDPTDTITLRATTHALWLGSLTTVTVSVAGASRTFSIRTTAPAPSLATPTLITGLTAQLVSTQGGTAALTTVGMNYNPGNKSTTLTAFGATNGDSNYLVSNGTTNLHSIAANTGITLQIAGTYANHMYHPDEYVTVITTSVSVSPLLDAGAGGDDNAIAQTAIHLEADGSPAGEENRILGEAWTSANSGITSNSQAVVFTMTAVGAESLTVLNSIDSGTFGIRHQGHPGASAVAPAGVGSPNLCMAQVSMTVAVGLIGGSPIHNVNILPVTNINFLPA